MADWHQLSDRTPEPGQAVLVKADDWRVPRVLEFCTKAGCPRLIDRLSGRFFWHPERMQWAAIPNWPAGVGDVPVAEAWRVERALNRRTLTTAYTVKRGDEFLRMAGKFTTIRRFRTEAGAQRACDKANAADGVNVPLKGKQ